MTLALIVGAIIGVLLLVAVGGWALYLNEKREHTDTQADLAVAQTDLADALAAVRRHTSRLGRIRGVAERANRRCVRLESLIGHSEADREETDRRALPAVLGPLSDQSIPAKPWEGDPVVIGLPTLTAVGD